MDTGTVVSLRRGFRLFGVEDLSMNIRVLVVGSIFCVVGLKAARPPSSASLEIACGLHRS